VKTLAVGKAVLRSLHAINNGGTTMPEAFAEGIEVEEEFSHSVETEQERLDRQGIYGEIKRELIKRGIPPQEIAFIHDFKTPAEKARAFANANAGKIRVMIASTEKAGAGTNMQERLCALHHLDAPWRPSDVEQREGRILRMKNRFSEVSIFNYVTEGSFDVYIWQTLESKARFIAQIMSGNVTTRIAEDVDDLVMTAAQVKAIATGNPRILEKVSIEVELSRLSRLYLVWRKSRRDMRYEIGSLQERVREAGLRVACHEQAVAVRNGHRLAGEEVFIIELRQSPRSDQWKTSDNRAQAGKHLVNLRREVELLASVEPCHIGSYRGFEVFAQRQPGRTEGLFDPVAGFMQVPGGQMRYGFNFGDSAQGILQSIDAGLRKLDSHMENALRAQAELRHKLEQIEKALSSGWEYAGRYEEFREKLRQVNCLLREEGAQVDEKQEFAVLDQEAFLNCERNGEPTHCLSEPSAAAEAVAAMPGSLAPAPKAENPVFSSENNGQQSPPAMAIEEKQCVQPQITLNDLRDQQHQQNQKPTRPSEPPAAQMSLW
jgi:hypothetical protein